MHTHMHTQERDHWITAALEDSHEDVNSDEYSAPGTPQSSDLEEAQISDLPATPPQLPAVGDLDTGIQWLLNCLKTTYCYTFYM